jgi:hypothetical protein
LYFYIPRVIDYVIPFVWLLKKLIIWRKIRIIIVEIFTFHVLLIMLYFGLFIKIFDNIDIHVLLIMLYFGLFIKIFDNINKIKINFTC